MNTTGISIGRLTVFLLLGLFLGGCSTEPGISDTEGQIRIDSLQIKLNDSVQRISREQQLFNAQADWKKLLSDTGNTQTKALDELAKTYKGSEVYYAKLVSAKNDVIFSSNRKLIKANATKPNIWLLIGIVLATGILGGIAGPRFSLLDEKTEEAVSKVKEKVDESKSQALQLRQTLNNNNAVLQGNNAMLQANNAVQNAIAGFENTSAELEDAVENLEKEAERKYAFLLFGIIAASLSFVALNLFNSKILDFKTEMDYFIFSGYCLLGAVFAKKWIVQIYDTISKKP